MADTSEPGPLSAQLEALRRADLQREAAEFAEWERQQQYEAAVNRYAEERMPSGELTEADRAAILATLRDVARRRLDGDQVPLFQGKGQFTLLEFWAERRALLQRLAELEVACRALARDELPKRDLHPNAIRSRLKVAAIGKRLELAREHETTSLLTLVRRVVELETRTESLRLRALARHASRMPMGGRSASGWPAPTVAPATEQPAEPAPDQTLSSDQPPVGDLPLLRGPGLPSKAPSGLSWEAWREKADDLRRRRARGESVLSAALKNDISDDTARRWMRWREKELETGLLLG